MKKKADFEDEDDLERKIQSLKTANAELLQTEKLASSGRIARTIAHEVRNPLTNIHMAADQLRSDLGDTIHEETALMLDMIHRNGRRINQLITDLLNSTELPPLEYQRISIHALLDQSLEAALDRIQLKDLQVVKAYATGIDAVLVDAEKMKIALLNIIINAVEAMEPGRGTLFLKTERDVNQCLISIADNGSGIEPDSLTKLFDPFFSLKSNGAGLGLTHTYNIILSHKGFITVDSQVGTGTTFRIILDLAPR